MIWKRCLRSISKKAVLLKDARSAVNASRYARKTRLIAGLSSQCLFMTLLFSVGAVGEETGDGTKSYPL